MATFDDVLAAGYLDDLRKLPLEVVRAKRGECQTVEAALSMERRLIQGRLDIVGAELRRRAGGDASDQSALVDDLKNILAERVRSPGYGRLSQLLAPAGDDEYVAEIEAAADANSLASLGDMDDDAVRSLADKLGGLEQDLSERRRKVHEHIDALQEEVVRRYKEGEATVEGLLSS
ncbi:MAG: aerial mycelium formation protein [Actinobacteria bacterium]|nr:aerial mycelium formation protein [Actinomycetota bacterium]